MFEKTLWLLANNQEAQSKLREEVTPVLRENPHPDYRTLKELQWLDCVMCVFDACCWPWIDDRSNSMESLRVLPPIPLAHRIANRTGYIGDVLVPKGTLIIIPVSHSISTPESSMLSTFRSVLSTLIKVFGEKMLKSMSFILTAETRDIYLLHPA